MPQVDFQTPNISYSYNAVFLLLGAASYTYTAPTGIDIEARIPYVYTGTTANAQLKVQGYRSDYTQIIANSFQDWNRIRKCADSTGQAIINSFAMGLEEVIDYWKDERREMFIDTADISTIWKIGRHPIPNYVELDETVSPNLLVNSSFDSPASCRYGLPMDWTDRWDYSDGIVDLHTGDSLFGTHCVKLTAQTGQRCGIWQEQDFVIPEGQQITFSLWYKNYETQEYHYTGDCNPFIQVSLTQDDRTTSTTKKLLRRGTNGKWVREYLTVTGSKDIGVINVGVELDNTTGTMNTREYYVDALMLERSDHPTQWMASEVDQPEFMRINDEYFHPPMNVEVWSQTGIITGSISGYQATGTVNPKQSMYYVGNYELFASRDLPPTRISVIDETGTVNGVSTQIWGLISNDVEEPFEKGWRIDNNTGILTYTWPYTDDTGKYYNFAEAGLNKEAIRTSLAKDVYSLYHRYTVPENDTQQTGGYNYSVEYNAMTIRDGMIWLVCQESWAGVTNKVLKLLNPRTERSTNYLEMIADFKLTGLSGTVTSVGFVEQDPPQLSISMTGESLTSSGALVNLHYDYYTFNRNARQIYTRDLHTGSNETLVIV